MRRLLVMLVLVGCHADGKALKPFGAPCTTDAECGTSNRFFCAPDHPGGYCAAECRSDEECGGAVCVRADPASLGHCHAGCKTDGDCRAGYICKQISPDASAPYCDPPQIRHQIRQRRSWWWR